MNIGNELQKAREDKGLSIEELQKKTKIRKKYLIALENNNFSEIKGEVYVKSFIKGYARAIGINPDPFIYEYEQYISNKKSDIASNKKESNKNVYENKYFKKIAIIVLIIIFLGTIGIVVYKNFIVNSGNFFKSSNKEIETSLNQNINLDENRIGKINNIEKNKFDIGKENIENKENLDLEENKITFDIPDNSNKDNDLNKKSKKENGSESSDSKTTEKETSEKSQKKLDKNNIIMENNNDDEDIYEEENTEEKDITEEVNIKIVANQITWIRVTLNKESTKEILFEGFLNENDEKNITFNRNNSLKFRIGNGAGIYILEDKQKYGPWGESGEVLEKKIYFENNLKIN